jgi:hypothetical protein
MVLCFVTRELRSCRTSSNAQCNIHGVSITRTQSVELDACERWYVSPPRANMSTLHLVRIYSSCSLGPMFMQLQRSFTHSNDVITNTFQVRRFKPCGTQRCFAACKLYAIHNVTLIWRSLAAAHNIPHHFIHAKIKVTEEHVTDAML